MKGSIDAFYQRLADGAADVVALARSRRRRGDGSDRRRDAATDQVSRAAVKAPAIVTPTQTADVLVIGSTGFIGQHLVEALAASGLEGARDGENARRRCLTPCATAASAVAEGDVRDRGGRCRGRSLAAGGSSISSPARPRAGADYERLYLDGTRHVAEACLDARRRAAAVRQLDRGALSRASPASS